MPSRACTAAVYAISGAIDTRTDARRPAPPCLRSNPDLAQVYRAKVERLHVALADPAIRDEAFEILRGLIERVVVHPGDDGPQIELVGEIVRMVELDAKQAALPKEAACSVKVVAGAGNHRQFEISTPV